MKLAKVENENKDSGVDIEYVLESINFRKHYKYTISTEFALSVSDLNKSFLYLSTLLHFTTTLLQFN